jgi:hypothetical protein
MALVLGLVAPTLFLGCSSTGVTNESPGAVADTQDLFTIDRSEYVRAFDAAIAMTDDLGMPAEVEDRDGGILETRPRVSGSLIEPWNWANGSVGDATDATVAFLRRRVRIEFFPEGFRASLPGEGDALKGVRTPGSVPPDANGAIDMRRYNGPIEVRVSVFIERAFTPGLQRSTWTLSQSSFYADALKARRIGPATAYDRSIWTPIERDREMERRLTAQLECAIRPTSAG